MIILPLFAAMTASIVWVVYTSTIDGFLESHNDHIERMMVDTLQYYFLFEDVKDPRIHQWFLDEVEKRGIKHGRELTEEETRRYLTYADADNYFHYEWFTQMPDDIRELFILQYYDQQEKFSRGNMSTYDDAVEYFVIELTPGKEGKVIFDFCLNDTSKEIGSYFDLDIDDHPVVQDMLDSGSGNVYFEKITDFPRKGNYYIGYRLYETEGELKVAEGLVYSWDDFRSSTMNTINKAVVISIGGIAAVLAVLIIFLHRMAIKPVKQMESALIAYTKDKDSAKVASKMLRVCVKNELGYLSEVISDLALEIDHYTKEVARSEKELYDARVQIMVSQIRPHFMYNTLSSIAMLCEIDPDAAQEMTITFAKYLRENMDSLKQTKPVPFTKELEHLKKYLYIEKIRFDERLNIEYDIQTTDFELPQLSIQPIVENSVKHGIGKKEEGGTVTIATRETDTAFEVIISDDGVGFDVNAPKNDDGRSHIGMENIKKRLKDMCNADIVIESEIGKGTTARVIIPKTKKEDTGK